MSDPQVSGSPQPGQAPPGWYADPSNAEQQRYWNGAAWTEQVAPRYIYGPPPVQQPVTPPPPQAPPAYAARPQATGPGGRPYASFGRRLLGYLIDMLVLAAGGAIVVVAIAWEPIQGVVKCFEAWTPSQNEIAQRTLTECVNTAVDSPAFLAAAIVSAVIQVVYFTLLLHFWGRTVGGQALGLRCVMVDGSKPTLVKAFVRSVIPFGFTLLSMVPGVGFVANILELVAYLAMLWSPKRQTWMDQAAGTYVVRVQ